MTRPYDFSEILATGEGKHVEFKEARDRLPGSFFDTVCAFLNTDGGTIYLGISDNGGITGVDQQSVGRLRSEIANLSNNPQQLDPPFLYKYLPLYAAGSMPVFQENEHRFVTVLPLAVERAIKQVGEQVSEHARLILDYCRTPRSRQEMLARAGLKTVYLNYKRHILPLVEKGFLEMTLPDKPTSRLQKYRLTEKGKKFLAVGKQR